MELKGKKVLVFGAGKSGIGAADLLNAVGACPVLYDGKADLDKESVLHKISGNYELPIYAGELPKEVQESLDLVVLSCLLYTSGRVITRKPILPSDEEMEENPRSKSAKLRIFEKKG